MQHIVKHFTIMFFLSSSLCANVIWNNSTISGAYVDQDIDIFGVNTVSGPVTVFAATRDITITINGQASLTGVGQNVIFQRSSNFKIIFSTTGGSLSLNDSLNVFLSRGCSFLSLSGKAQLIVNDNVELQTQN